MTDQIYADAQFKNKHLINGIIWDAVRRAVHSTNGAMTVKECITTVYTKLGISEFYEAQFQLLNDRPIGDLFATYEGLIGTLIRAVAYDLSNGTDELFKLKIFLKT